MIPMFGNLDLESIKESNLQDLIDQRVEESIILEFKKELASNSKEVAKDLSSMANSEGGFVIYGIQEDADGRANSINWINSSENFEEKIENITATTINPPISFKVFPIHKEREDTRLCYLVLIPKSNNLHMVIKGGDNRYYKRSGKTIRKMEDSEIKERISLINLNKEDAHKTIDLLKSDFQELTGTNLTSTERINYYIIPDSVETKVQTISELREIVDSLTNDFSEGVNFNSYKGTVSNSIFSDSRKWHKSTIMHKNGIIEFRKSHDYVVIFASIVETRNLIKIINYTNNFYKKIGYFGGYKICMEIGNIGKYGFGKTLENSEGLYGYSLGELKEIIEIDPLLIQNPLKNSLKILELMKLIGGVVGIRGDDPYEEIKKELKLS